MNKTDSQQVEPQISLKRKAEQQSQEITKKVRNPIHHMQSHIKITDKLLEKAYDNFRKIAQMGCDIPESQELDESLQILYQYKQESLQIIVTEEILPNSSQTPITTQIFTKKPSQFLKNVKQMSPQLIAFENYLHLVTMMYYKKNINMAEMLISLENGKENSNSKQSQSALQPKKENKSTSKQQAKKIVKKEEPGDKKGRGRQAKKKEDEILLSQILAEEQEEIEFQELQRQMKETVEENNSEQNGSEPGSPSNRPIYSSKQNKEEKDGAKNQDSQAIYYSNLLDSLLSPIRFEQIYVANERYTRCI